MAIKKEQNKMLGRGRDRLPKNLLILSVSKLGFPNCTIAITLPNTFQHESFKNLVNA